MHREPLVEEALTRSVIGAFYEVYNTLGYGYVEGLYVKALARELVARGHRVAREVCVVVMYKGERLGSQRIDMVVDDKLVIETKSTERVPQSAMRQLFSHLKSTRLDVGLLLHFGPKPRFYRRIFRDT